MKIVINQLMSTSTSIQIGDANNNISRIPLVFAGVRKERGKLTIGRKSYELQIEYDEQSDLETSADGNNLEKIVRDLMRASGNGHCTEYRVIIHRTGDYSDTYLVTQSGIEIASMEQKMEMMNSGIVPGINVVVVVSPPITCFGGIVASGAHVQAQGGMITPRAKKVPGRFTIGGKSYGIEVDFEGTPGNTHMARLATTARSVIRTRGGHYTKYRMIVGFLGTEGKPNPTILSVSEVSTMGAPVHDIMFWLNSP